MAVDLVPSGTLRKQIREDVLKEAIYEGKTGECIAVREIEKGKYIVVIYNRDLSKEDGFVITPFLTRRKKQLERRRKIWQR